MVYFYFIFFLPFEFFPVTRFLVTSLSVYPVWKHQVSPSNRVQLCNSRKITRQAVNFSTVVYDLQRHCSCTNAFWDVVTNYNIHLFAIKLGKINAYQNEASLGDICRLAYFDMKHPVSDLNFRQFTRQFISMDNVFCLKSASVFISTFWLISLAYISQLQCKPEVFS